MGSNSDISVIIPVHNGSRYLPSCLETITPLADDVIVVDDASSDNSAAIAAEFQCRVLPLSRQVGPAAARNAGARLAQGEILFFTDADVAVKPDVLRHVREVLVSRPDIDALIGAYSADTPANNFVSRYKNFLHHYTHWISAGFVASFFTGCGAIRGSVWKVLGGFDETITATALEDVELGYRLHRCGYKVWLDPALQVTHLKRYNLATLIRSDFWGRAVPYARLMLRHRIFPAQLSTRSNNTASVFLVFATPIVVAAVWLAGWTGPALAIGFISILAFLALNARFYAFLWRQAGLAFVLPSVGLQAFIYLYSGLGFIAGAIAHLLAQLLDRNTEECSEAEG